ncbi:hypothetical protein D3C73_1464540 [compost metagenome]
MAVQAGGGVVGKAFFFTDIGKQLGMGIPAQYTVIYEGSRIIGVSIGSIGP